MEIGAWVAFVTSVATLINLLTRHYSAYPADGPWYVRVLRTALWLVERVAYLSSDGQLSLPGLERKPASKSESGSVLLESAVAVIGLIIIVVALWGGLMAMSGCAASTRYALLSASQTTIERATDATQRLCEPVRAKCAEDGDTQCAREGECLAARVTAAKALRSVESAIALATLAESTGDATSTQHWISVASEGVSTAMQIIADWSKP